MIILIIGVSGWPVASLGCNIVLWVCDWKDGIENDWGSNVFWLLVGTMAMAFAWLEIAILYIE